MIIHSTELSAGSFELSTMAKLAEHFIYYSDVVMAMLTPDMRYIYWSKRWETYFEPKEPIFMGAHHYRVFPQIATLKPEWVLHHVHCSEGEKVEGTDEFDGKKFRWKLDPLYPLNSGKSKAYHILMTVFPYG